MREEATEEDANDVVEIMKERSVCLDVSGHSE